MQRLRVVRMLAMLATAALLAAACADQEDLDDLEEEPDDAAVEETDDEPDDEADDEPDDEPDDEADDEADDGGEAAGAWQPEQPITMLVPFDAGSGADVPMRTWSERAEEIAGEPITVENQPGGGGTIGWAEFVNQSGDGHQLSIVTPPFNIIPALVTPDEIGYELEDFQYVCRYATVPEIFYVAEGAFDDIEELIEHARENPGEVSTANTGTLGADHLMQLLLEEEADIELTEVAFEGGAESAAGVLSGVADIMIGSGTYLETHEGELRPLAIAEPERLEDDIFADIPTFVEHGYEVIGGRFRTIAGPPDMPEEAVEYWGEVCEDVDGQDDWAETMLDIGHVAGYLDPDETRDAVEEMTDNIEEILRELGEIE